ncbi:hypothetical protein KVR01_011651 [Diaporthe batatas]|uniref:uncharacterized protein n=1 Tax=Diaporthe batatas TaxID=748121 RepID=UPI001D049B5D|nr:uncharacterized protein KVR01_011651 [Diaporthe batatas]KAG8158529.1 hypothetical protein KVR01_011651 [Diaporthe batatas]
MKNRKTEEEEKKKEIQRHGPHPTIHASFLRRSVEPWYDLTFFSRAPGHLTEQLGSTQFMLLHASIALLTTECNAVQGWPLSCNNHRRACAHRSAVAALWSCPFLGDPSPAWPLDIGLFHPACVNLKPVEQNLSLSFETAAPTSQLPDREPPNAVAHCIVTHAHSHTPHTLAQMHLRHQQHTDLAISSCELRHSDPLVQRQVWSVTRIMTPRRD